MYSEPTPIDAITFRVRLHESFRLGGPLRKIYRGPLEMEPNPTLRNVPVPTRRGSHRPPVQVQGCRVRVDLGRLQLLVTQKNLQPVLTHPSLGLGRFGSSIDDLVIHPSQCRPTYGAIKEAPE